MTIYEFVQKYHRAQPGGHFFDRQTLEFFGERLSEMRVLRDTATITAEDGKTHECYVLSRFQRKHPRGPRRTYAFFDIETLDDVGVNARRG